MAPSRGHRVEGTTDNKDGQQNEQRAPEQAAGVRSAVALRYEGGAAHCLAPLQPPEQGRQHHNTADRRGKTLRLAFDHHDLASGRLDDGAHREAAHGSEGRRCGQPNPLINSGRKKDMLRPLGSQPRLGRGARRTPQATTGCAGSGRNAFVEATRRGFPGRRCDQSQPRMPEPGQRRSPPAAAPISSLLRTLQPVGDRQPDLLDLAVEQRGQLVQTCTAQESGCIFPLRVRSRAQARYLLPPAAGRNFRAQLEYFLPNRHHVI